MAAQAGDRRFGVFSLATLQLALPLEALREVVPLSALSALPCAAPCVIGGIDLRGVLVPVVDLRVVIGLPAAGSEPRSIVIMVFEERLLGLLASGVVGVFECPEGGWSPMVSRNGELSIFGGGFRRPDDGSMVSVLSPVGLAGLRDVPMVENSGRDPSQLPRGGELGGGGLTEAYLMLVRTGSVPMALASEAVHTTILHPEILNSPLTGGWCLGIIEHAGRKVPAVDLLALCGLGEIANPWLTQAFLIQYPQGLVAFMVDQIIDVVRADARGLVPIPPGTLPGDALFAGALPMDALPGVTAGSDLQAAYFLMLDAGQVIGHRDLSGLARMNTPVDARGLDAGRVRSDGERRLLAERCQVLTYDLGFEVATPIDQIAEILPQAEDKGIVFGAGSRAAGLVVSRGRAIPTFCLSSLMGLAGAERSPTASVLVVETETGCVGFNVARLMTIDDAPLNRPDAPGVGRSPLPSLPEGNGARWSPAMVGSGAAERMLSVLDLKHLARTLSA